MPFKVEVKKHDLFDDKHALRISSNGYQWTSFGTLSPEQLLKIERAIHEYLVRLLKTTTPPEPDYIEYLVQNVDERPQPKVLRTPPPEPPPPPKQPKTG